MLFSLGRSREPVYRSGALSSMEVGNPSGDRFIGKNGRLGRLLAVRHGGNPGVVPASHQHAILSLAQIGNAHRKPDSDRRQRHGEGQGGDIGQHAMTEIVRLVAGPFVAGQIFAAGPALLGPGAAGIGCAVNPPRRFAGGWAEVRGRNLTTTCSLSLCMGSWGFTAVGPRRLWSCEAPGRASNIKCWCASMQAVPAESMEPSVSRQGAYFGSRPIM